MTDLADVVQMMESTVLSVRSSAGIDPAADWESLKPALPRLIKESVPLLARLHAMLGEMDEPARAQLLSELGKRSAQRGPSETSSGAIFLILYLFILGYDLHKETVYVLERQDLDVINPPKDYWFQRVDGEASHSFFDGGLYLVNAIPPAPSTTYFNSEIYNSPYTSIRPKNVVINKGQVDDPCKEPGNFLYDLFLNRPYVAQNGTIFSARVKAQNLEGGSRGWGYWNTSTSPLGGQIAWFIQFNGVADGKPYGLNGFWAQTQNGLGISLVRLPELDEGWHDYRIETRPDSVRYFIDNCCVADVTNKPHELPVIPSEPLSFHNWVDNAVFDLKDLTLVHVPQETRKPRVNYTETMRIYSGPINPHL